MKTKVIYPNKNIKPRFGFLKSQKLSIPDFNTLLHREVEDLDKWGILERASLVNLVIDDLPEEFKEDLKQLWTGAWPDTLDVCDKIKIIKGTPYLSVTAFRECLGAFVFYIYWDGEKLRAYVPLHGNRVFICKDKKLALYGGPCIDIDTIRKSLIKDNLEKGEEYRKLRGLSLTDFVKINYTWCLKEFEMALSREIIDYEY